MIYHLQPCVCWSAASSFQTNLGQQGHGFLVGPPCSAEDPVSHVRLTGYPNLRQTVETDSRARPAFELGVDSPGATRICSLLVRGTLTFRSFRRLPSHVETGRTCDVYNGQLVHPCRVNLFEKPCPRLWTT